MDTKESDEIFEQLLLINQKLTNIEFEISSLNDRITLFWGELVAQSRLSHKKTFASTLSEEDIKIETSRWVKQISNILGDHEGCIVATDIYKMLGLDRNPKLRSKATTQYIIHAMASLGWQRKQFKDGKHMRWGYVKGDTKKHIYVFRDPVTLKIYVGNTPSFMTEKLKL
jgi:hypothetical protein